MKSEIIKAVTKIANDKNIQEKCEPHVPWHHTIIESETYRVLYSFLLFIDEMAKIETRGENKNESRNE